MDNTSLNTRHFQVGETRNLLDEAIDRHAEAYLLADPEIIEFSPFERSGTFKYYIGMICTNDCEKPDPKQMKIRGSSSLTQNKIVELDVSMLNGYHSFFPGQIIAFTAEPFQSRQLVVRKILDPLMIAPKMKKLDNDEKINLLIAAGPLMNSEIEDWTLFDNLVESIKKDKATHVILLGPLVDKDNKELRAKFETSWRRIYDKLLEELYDEEVRVYIVPSTRDILPCSLNSNYFYPCPKLDFTQFKRKDIKKGLKIKCSIESVSDPSQIDLGGVWLDLTSAEILFHMNKCTLHINKNESIKPLESLYKHIITHGIYPLYPSPSDLAVDRVKLNEHIQLNRLGPQIIVLTTRFAPTISVVENRLVICVPKCSVKKQAIFIEIPSISQQEINLDEGFDSQDGSVEPVEDEVKMELNGDGDCKPLVNKSSFSIEINDNSQFSRSKWRIETLGDANNSKKLLEPKLELKLEGPMAEQTTATITTDDLCQEQPQEKREIQKEDEILQEPSESEQAAIAETS